MIFRNSLNFINQLFSNSQKNLRKVYLNSNYYDRKISKIYQRDLVYKPSPHLLSSLIKYQTKKVNIKNISTEDLWGGKNNDQKNFIKLNNFYWFFSLDLKSSKKIAQQIISEWTEKNIKYNSKSWEFDITSKRIISWLSNHSLTIEEANSNYLKIFNEMIQKQANHLIIEANNSKTVDNKIVGCAAIILVGICYGEKNYLTYGLSLLKKIANLSLDNHGFPKSRDIKQLIFYLKYFILIREWFRESQIEIPEYINETIHYLGKGYAFVWQNTKFDILMNGNNISDNDNFDQYLKRFGYNFKNEEKEFGGYAILNNKRFSIAMDIGSSPTSKFSSKYQSGALSFEIISNGKKLISNCGYFEDTNNKLNKLSKSTATHSTLMLDDSSSCYYRKFNEIYLVDNGLRVTKKNIVFEKNYWKINASHDGYLKKYNSIHEREIEFYPEQIKFIGSDKILNKKNNHNMKFDIRFHLEPNAKLMKTQDNKTVLIELYDEGWKFICENYDINIDNGLYFGKKNLYTQNQNFFISGITTHQLENIIWQLYKI
tara:strand:- start:555 stop:2180 length:1626 start_codon:yes stop_codon:yes gene_type:complete